MSQSSSQGSGGNPHLRPDLVYRAFGPRVGDHIAQDKAPGTFRLSSALFKSKNPGVSFYLGEFTTLEDVCRKHPQYGVCSLPLALLQAKGVQLGDDPHAQPDDLPGHRVAIMGDKRVASDLAAAATIQIRLPGHQVVGAHGSIGVPAGDGSPPV